MKYLSLIILIFFIGCEDVSSNKQQIGGDDTVKEIRLKNGTPCAVSQSVYGSGITCDWNNK